MSYVGAILYSRPPHGRRMFVMRRIMFSDGRVEELRSHILAQALT